MTTYLIISQSLGVYIGSCLDKAIWSKVDAAGQDQAKTFKTYIDALLYIENSERFPKDINVIPVVEDICGYASISACVSAGAPHWNPNKFNEFDDIEAELMIKSHALDS